MSKFVYHHWKQLNQQIQFECHYEWVPLFTYRNESKVFFFLVCVIKQSSAATIIETCFMERIQNNNYISAWYINPNRSEAHNRNGELYFYFMHFNCDVRFYVVQFDILIQTAQRREKRKLSHWKIEHVIWDLRHKTRKTCSYQDLGRK